MGATDMYTFDLATPDHIVGRIVGDLREHVAVAVASGQTSTPALTGYLLAAARDGKSYCTWAYGVQSGRVTTYWGHPFHAVDHGGVSGAFDAAVADLAARAEVG